MFDKARYLTRGIQARIPVEIQLVMWGMIGDISNEKRDYLQVFNLTWNNGKLIIKHSQEVPMYESTVTFDSTHTNGEEKIFVIDDGDYSTMLLAEEY